MPINVIFLAKIAINNHFHIVSNKIQSYHNFFLTFSNISNISNFCNTKMIHYFIFYLTTDFLLNTTNARPAHDTTANNT